MRTNNYLGNIKGKFFLLPIFLFSKLMQRHLKFKFGIQIPSITKIDKGLFIGHFSCIFVHSDVVIGKNFTISQGVSIGVANRGSKKGTAIIGDNVYVGPGAKIFGHINIGNDAAIGANAVLTIDLPPKAVAVGVPAKVISLNGSEGYANNRI
jgi:serine O-acetyltransferase